MEGKWWLYSQGWTALSYASSNGHPEVVALLLDRGAALDHTSNRGHSMHICKDPLQRMPELCGE